jgi:hypothetical protein
MTGFRSREPVSFRDDLRSVVVVDFVHVDTAQVQGVVSTLLVGGKSILWRASVGVA